MRTVDRWTCVAVGVGLLVASAAGCGAKPSPTMKRSESAPTTKPTEGSPPVQTKALPPSAVSPPAASDKPGEAKSAPSESKSKPTVPKIAERPKLATKKAMTDLPASKPTAAESEPKTGSAPEEAKTLFYQPSPEVVKEKPSAEEDKSYTVVKVFYATDRSPMDVGVWRQSLRGGWPKLTGMCAVLTAVLMLARFRRGRVVMRSLAWLSLAATLVLGGLTIAYQWLPESADPPIERMYGNDRGELEMGTCEVSIPKEHEVGQLESPTVLRLEFRQDPERHVVLLGVQPEAPSKFFGDLRACIDRTARQEAFVFVHGYNVGFEAAVRRTAQIAYDLKFEGAPIVYSWPSQEGLLSYTVDETNVAWTVPHLKEFLLGVAEKSGAKSVHLVAHSMGNRALTSALRELTMERKTECPRFHEVVLTAPDIDADVFRRDLAPAIVGTADRVTLYASSNDEALIASRTVHGYRRAGESGKMVVVVPGIDTVDVSEIDTSLIGHSYYGSNSTVLADLFELLQGSKSPDQRTWLRSMRLGALKYWKFLRDPGRASPSEGEPL